MNPKGRVTLRVSTLYFAIAVAAPIILFLLGTASILLAQNPQAEKVLYNFAPATGFNPGGLTGDSAGNLYAAAIDGGSNRTCPSGCGGILKLAIPGNAATLYTFTPSDGHNPPSPTGLVRDAMGNLYTTLGGGGRYFLGSVFKVTPSGSAGTLYSFQGGNDGYGPNGGVTIDSAGNLYGTTAFGGGTSCSTESGNGCGIVYKLAPSGSETVLYRFTGGADGLTPAARPILDAAGNLYGTAALGGDLSCSLGQGEGCGTVWKLDTSGNFTVLYTFLGGTDGAFPETSLLMDSSGNFYGVNGRGGNLSCLGGLGCGVVFKVDSSTNFSVLYAFNGGSSDGEIPSGPLIRDGSGNLYGAAEAGGNQSCIDGCGVVFKLDSSDNETILHFFKGGTTDGSAPETGLITDGKGNLYGTTVLGGLANDGVIFQLQMQ